ncbi:RebB family R body protein [Vibrio proteolyticus]
MSSVNDQITDSVSDIHTLLTGGSPSQAMGMLDVTGTETLGMTMYNAVTAQQNSQTSAGAALNASCARILKTETVLPTPKSKEALELELKKIQWMEEKLKSEVEFELIKELRKSNSSISKTLIDGALDKAIKEVEKTAEDSAKPLLANIAKELKAKFDSLV